MFTLILYLLLYIRKDLQRYSVLGPWVVTLKLEGDEAFQI